MTNKQVKQIFEKYNPENAVKRCPSGRAQIRKQLDTYAKAATNLYGIISINDFADIFNDQNQELVNAEDILTLLLPGILKYYKKQYWPKYCFYKNCLIQYMLIGNYELADHLLSQQADKPRYIPGKDEFLEFADEYYEDGVQHKHWDDVLNFNFEEWPKTADAYKLYKDLKECSQLLGEMKFADLLRKYNLSFTSEKRIQPFFDLISAAHNNTRMWMNNGHTPEEIMKVKKASLGEDGQDQIFIRGHQKTGPNEPCPCGSGKKYKKCCRIVEETKTAQLHWSECLLFYETWYGLMGFVNKKKNILPVEIKPIYPNPINDEAIYHVREVLWENPGLIDDYLASASLSKEKFDLLSSWRKCFVKGMFTVAEHKAEYSVLLTADEKREDKLYAVKGISRSLANVLPYELPITIEAVLLPFKDKIIYDTLIGTMDIRYGKGAKDMFAEMYKNALGKGITTSLGS